MAEIGGSSTDVSASILANAGNSPSTSNDSIKEGALKRPLNIEDTAAVKKKKSAEELASTSKGRNKGIKKVMKDEKKKRKRKSKLKYDRASLLAHRDKLMERLGELENREMALTDKAEERLMKREDAFRDALLECQNALNQGELSGEEDEESVMTSLDIHIPQWPSLDVHVNEFAIDRLYSIQHQGEGVSMTYDILNDIITKVKLIEPTIGLPTENDKMEMDRLLVAVNWQIREAVKERRFDHLTKNLEDFPGIDPSLLPEKEATVKMENGVFEQVVGRVIEACGGDGGDGKEIEVINLDDDDDEEIEKEEDDDDELNEEEDEYDEDIAREDEQDLRLLGMMDNPPSTIEVADDETMTENEMIPIETANDLHNHESMADEAKEEKDRSDSREGKEMMEGGTSTNSPTVDRDERMNDLEKIDDIHLETVADSAEIEEVAMERSGENGGERETHDGQMEMNAFVADTIVLDDDDEEEEEVQDITMESTRRKETPVVFPDLIEEDHKVIGPPKSTPMTSEEALRVKNIECQKWVNKLTSDPVDEKEEEEEPQKEKSDEEEVEGEGEEKDDEIECIQDDFEWDSVSHSGLRPRHLKMAENGEEEEGEGEEEERREGRGGGGGKGGGGRGGGGGGGGGEGRSGRKKDEGG
ncbi:hypothetical protein PENTCL1PPCAC_22582, partial [Pristionchus entomophagus]